MNTTLQGPLIFIKTLGSCISQGFLNPMHNMGGYVAAPYKYHRVHHGNHDASFCPTSPNDLGASEKNLEDT